jgi:predicted PurR-regulated permease PerM
LEFLKTVRLILLWRGLKIPLIEIDSKKTNKRAVFKNKKVKNYALLLRVIFFVAIFFIIGFTFFQIYRQINLYYELRNTYNELNSQKEVLNKNIEERNDFLSELRNRLAEKGVELNDGEIEQMDLYNFP